MINKIIGKIVRFKNSLEYKRKNKELAKNCKGEIITLGNIKYGAWTICASEVNKDSIVYSFGVGEDLSFDLELIEKFNCRVYAFDPTPKSLEWIKKQDLPENLKFYPWGIESKNGEMTFYPPENPDHASYSVLPKNNDREPIKASVFTLDHIMKNLGHKKLDILKMDIEGSEYAVLDYILSKDFDIKQILVEFHDRFESVEDNASHKSIKRLEKAGYNLFHISKNGEELSFIRQK